MSCAKVARSSPMRTSMNRASVFLLPLVLSIAVLFVPVERASADSAAPEPAAAQVLDALRVAAAPGRPERDQERAVEALVEAVRGGTGLTAQTRAWLRAQASPLLVSLSSEPRNASWARVGALMALRDIEAETEVVREAMALATADTSSAAGLLASRVEILDGWLADRTERPQGGPLKLAPQNPEAERQALALLSERGVAVSESSLTAAAMAADVELLRALLDAGIDVNMAFRDVPNLLGYAAALGCSVQTPMATRLAAIQLLIDREIDLERPGADGSTPLMGAARHCPVEVVNLLINAGADAAAVDANGRGSLAVAFTHGRWEVAERLVQAGARLPREQLRSLFIELPQDPQRRGVIESALQPL